MPTLMSCEKKRIQQRRSRKSNQERGECWSDVLDQVGRDVSRYTSGGMGSGEEHIWEGGNCTFWITEGIYISGAVCMW